MRIFTIIFLIACAFGTSIKTFNDANYKEYLVSDWCPACKRMAAKFEELSQKSERLQFLKCSESPVLFMRFLIKRLPTIFILEDDLSVRDVTEMVWRGKFDSDAELPSPRSSYIAPFSYFGYFMGYFGRLGNFLTDLMGKVRKLSGFAQVLVVLGSVFAIPLILLFSSSLGYITGIIAYKIDKRFRRHVKKD